MIDQTLLVEVRTEELPPALLWRLGNDFPDALLESLRQTGFATAKSKRFCKDKKNPTNQKVTTQTITFATPRRLAALLENIPAESPPRDDFRRGPQLTACHDKDGAPTKALIGFMHSVGVTCEKDLTQTEDKERVYVAWKGTQPGKKLADELPILVEKTLLHLSAPRLMRWGDYDYKFIRPVRGVVLMHGTSVINGCVLGKQTSNSTQGHRALSSGDIIISSADKYELVMEENGNVIVDFESRKNNIREQLWEKENEIEKYIGLSLTPPNKKWDFPDEMSSFGNQVVEINLQGKTKRVVIPGKTEIGYDTNLLLQEVTAMCEKPTVYQGVVEKDFLSLPTFCTVGCMTKHQRYFPLWESEKSLHLKEGKLSQHYLFVADNKPKNDRGMIDGFNTVLRARLRDVDFYIREDKKLSLDSALEKLKDIVYHQKLGSQYQRVERLQNITANIAELMNLDEQQQHTLVNATKICKADLSTLMIGEYPEFEGMMAAEYCCQKTDSITGQPSDVYELVRWHNNYENSPLPLLPSENKFLKMGSVLILACQLEKLVGLFGIGEKPAGNKDPHGLRGAAAMIVNILTLTRYALPTDKLINIARNTFDKLPQFNISEIQNFIDGRLRAILLAEKPLLTTKEESQKKITKKNMLNAIFSTPQPMLRDVAPKIDALYNFIQREEANSLIEANKRVNNIFRKSDVRANNLQSPDESLFCEKEERELWAAITKFKNNNRTDIKEQEFSSLLQELLKIAQPVSAFFEHVMVNTDDERIRTNRFALLAELRKQLNQVADISKLSG